MLRIITKQKILLQALTGYVLLILNMLFFNSPFLGVIGLLMCLFPICYWIIKLLDDKEEGRFFYASITLLSGLIILTTVFYYLFAINKATSLIILLIPLVLFLLGKDHYFEFEIPKLNFSKIKKAEFFSILILLSIEIILFIILLANRTFELMPSPWQAVEPWYFILYAIATGVLFFIIFKSKSTKTTIILSSIHLLITFIITAILYPLGYGFDAFVHRATEMWILQNGSISPKQPYYIGQYSFVVWLAQLTKIPLFYIDIYLVPLLASITIPATMIYSLKRAWNIPAKYSAFSVWLIPFIPFLSLHLTTPHNVVLLFSILLIFLSLAYTKDKLNILTLIFLSIANLATHPLVGAPMFIFTLAIILVKKIKKNKHTSKIILFFAFIFTTASLPLMFILNNVRADAGNLNFTNPFLKLIKFFELFARPYWYAKNTPFIYELLYFWQRLIIPFIILLAIFGLLFILSKRRMKFLLLNFDNKNLLPNNVLLLYILTPISFVMSAWLLRSWVVFPDVVSYEQGDFPLRLVKASILFILPFTVYCLLFTLQKIEKLKKRKIYLGLMLILCSILLMISLYLSYPQRNVKARFPGLNATMSDFNAVEWIHNRHDKYNYIVLSNQLVSAAALSSYSFAKYYQTPNGEIFYYSVPTGGLLYKQYGKMLYEGQKREYMNEAMNITNVDTAYFVLNSYWANSEKIAEGAKKTADSWKYLDDGKIMIFIYKR